MRSLLLSKYSASLFTIRARSSATGCIRCRRFDKDFDFAFVEQAESSGDPAFAVPDVMGKQGYSEIARVLADVVEIDDLNGAWKVLLGRNSRSRWLRRQLQLFSWRGSTLRYRAEVQTVRPFRPRPRR